MDCFTSIMRRRFTEGVLLRARNDGAAESTW
jgi:hypothetical protein